MGSVFPQDQVVGYSAAFWQAKAAQASACVIFALGLEQDIDDSRKKPHRLKPVLRE
jgi:hypothetical protein